ncbi:MAG: hypothetical protein CVT92_12175 [Bacteroidetes bacterium HGW-Bacteroidetes-1]|jgi:hypothetical protein|nr:MAG: hypothetical protein CVT92_12175 [Bacteroidetes bacterium HGW-Bacteroidetes-1]
MFENLGQSYPFNNNFKHNLRTITLVSMGFMLISLYFQPFGIDFLASRKDGYFVLALGVVSALTLLFNSLVLPGLFPRVFESSRWTIRKELIWNVWQFATLIIGFSISALILNITGMLSLTIFRSGTLALLPLILFNLMNYNSALKTKVTNVIDSGRSWFNDEDINPISVEHERVHIQSENGKEVFDEALKNVILIQSAGNYIEIFYRNGDSVRRQIIRQTLSGVEKYLSVFPDILKCHRRCLVNTNQMKRLGGISPNYTFEVDGLDFRIPVSRHKVAEFRKLFSGK